MNLNGLKRQAAAVLDVSGINDLGHFVQRKLFSPFIRVINYHDITSEHTANFRSHLEYYKEHFADVDETTFRAFLSEGQWNKDKPGLIISFDDGMRSHFEIAAPMLEKHGFTGWFFVPAGWIAEGIEDDPKAAHQAGCQHTLTLEQLKYLDRVHVVGCHTETHCRMSDDLTDEIMRAEILGAKDSLQKMLGHDISIFCWVGGEEFTYSRRAADLVRQGYDLSFMTNTHVVTNRTDPLQIQRTNIEAENPLSLVRFQLSGVMDALYFPKRRRVNALTGR